jgi:oligoendopeptidase F
MTTRHLSVQQVSVLDTLMTMIEHPLTTFQERKNRRERKWNTLDRLQMWWSKTEGEDVGENIVEEKALESALEAISEEVEQILINECGFREIRTPWNEASNC